MMSKPKYGIILGCFIVLIISCLANATTQKTNIIEKDSAVFRVETEVVLLSEFKQILHTMLAFKCVANDSLLLSALDLNWTVVASMQKRNLNTDSLSAQYELINRIIKLVKIKRFVRNQRVIIDAGKLKKWQAHSCLGQQGFKWNKNLEEYFRVETFVYERFNRKGLNTERIDVQVKSSIQLFLLTLDKKFHHNVFF